ncbi:MAG: ZIP family metal transporter [Pseudomonadota bacterium]
MGLAGETVVAVLLLALVSGLSTLIGVTAAIGFVAHHRRGIAFGIGFSVGIMLLIAVLELMPGAFERVGWLQGLFAASLGMALVALLHLVIPHRHLFMEQGMMQARAVRTAYLVAFGLVLHDFPEGFAMANAYLASPGLGVTVALAIAAHNIPEEFAMAAPAVGVKSRRWLYGAAVVSALAEPAGAALGLVAVSLAPGFHAFFIAFAAGAMIFISLHELLPMARQYRQPLLMVGGMGLSAVVYALLTTLLPQ